MGPCQRPADWDLPCHLKRHHVTGFGQFAADALLSDPTLQQDFRKALLAAIGRRPGGRWIAEDASVDAAWLPPSFPTLLRRKLAIPRCVNTVSIYLLFLLDIVVQLVVYVYVRRLWRWRFGTVRPEDEKWILALVVCIACVLVAVIFSVLHWWLPYVEEPHVILNAVLLSWFYLASHRMLLQQVATQVTESGKN